MEKKQLDLFKESRERIERNSGLPLDDQKFPDEFEGNSSDVHSNLDSSDDSYSDFDSESLNEAYPGLPDDSDSEPTSNASLNGSSGKSRKKTKVDLGTRSGDVDEDNDDTEDQE
jgi:hypothetical protein